MFIFLYFIYLFAFVTGAPLDTNQVSLLAIHFQTVEEFTVLMVDCTFAVLLGERLPKMEART